MIQINRSGGKLVLDAWDDAPLRKPTRTKQTQSQGGRGFLYHHEYHPSTDMRARPPLRLETRSHALPSRIRTTAPLGSDAAISIPKASLFVRIASMRWDLGDCG